MGKEGITDKVMGKERKGERRKGKRGRDMEGRNGKNGVERGWWEKNVIGKLCC